MGRNFLATILLTFLAACPKCHAQDAPGASPESKKAAERLNHLGLSLLKAMPDAKKRNLALSPWPTYRSLALTHLGSAGDTRKELSDFLQTEDPIKDLQQLLAVIDPQIASWNELARGGRELGQRVDQLAWASISAVWTKPDLPVHNAYRLGASQMHGTVVRGIDFKNADKALVDINTWIANATEQRIPRLLGPGSFTQDTVFCISSITFFKAPWHFFKPRATQAQPFLVDGLDPTPVPTMISNHSFGSEVHETFTALTLPIGHSFRLLLLVPKNPTGLRTLIETVDVGLLQKCTQLKQTEIKLHLPRFKIAPSTLQLREFLRARGVKSAFDNTGKADFSALSARAVYLDQVHDAAQFEIDENGVSGAGASVIVGMALGGDGDPLPPKTVFRVNRPFLFALQHQDTSACIFLGCVSDPRSPEPKEH